MSGQSKTLDRKIYQILLLQDAVIAVDCRNFHDPNRHQRGGSAPRNKHLGFHHTVMEGMLQHGAQVWRVTAGRKVQQPLKDWWGEFVCAPFWDAAMKVRGQRQQSRGGSSSSSGGSAPAPSAGRVVVVFFCKWGRHRSVALHECFTKMMEAVQFATLVESSHLASHSWSFTTCNFCQAAR